MEIIQAIILDFDGVLLESNEAKDRAFENLFSFYPSYADEMMKYHLEKMSTPRMKKFEYYIGVLMNLPGDTAAVKEMAARFSELVFQRVIRCPEVRGARSFLEEFHSRLPLYVSSLTPQEELIQIIDARNFGGFFKQIFGYPPVEKIEAIRQVIETEAVSPGEVVFIGDSPSDYVAAGTTGVRFIGRDSGQHTMETDIFIYSDLNDIGSVLRSCIEISERQ